MTTVDSNHCITCSCKHEDHETLTWWIDMIADQMARCVPNNVSYGVPGWRKISVVTTLEDLDTLRHLLIEKRASLPTWDGS